MEVSVGGFCFTPKLYPRFQLSKESRFPALVKNPKKPKSLAAKILGEESPEEWVIKGIKAPSAGQNNDHEFTYKIPEEKIKFFRNRTSTIHEEFLALPSKVESRDDAEKVFAFIDRNGFLNSHSQHEFVSDIIVARNKFEADLDWLKENATRHQTIAQPSGILRLSGMLHLGFTTPQIHVDKDGCIHEVHVIQSLLTWIRVFGIQRQSKMLKVKRLCAFCTKPFWIEWWMKTRVCSESHARSHRRRCAREREEGSNHGKYH